MAAKTELFVKTMAIIIMLIIVISVFTITVLISIISSVDHREETSCNDKVVNMTILNTSTCSADNS